MGIRKTRIARLLAVIAMLLALLCLCSCKYTDVLTNHLEDPVNGTLDITAEPEYRENPNAPEDLSKPASTQRQSDNLNQQQSTQPVFSPNTFLEVKTDKPEQSQDTNKNEEAAKGNDHSENDGDSNSSNSKGEGNGTDGKAGDDADTDDSSKGDSDENEQGEDGEGGDEGTGGKGGEGKVYNDGTYTELPEDVGSIAATGQYAVIVQMLAGKGGLAACDEKTLKAIKKSGAFGYKDDDQEGIGSVTAAWSGDGHKNGSVDVEALIEAKPDAVLTDGATTALSASETKKLNKAGIDVVSVPRLGKTYTSDDDVIKAVRLVGKLLKNADTQYDAQKKAKAYVKMHDDTLKACRDENDGYSYKVVHGRSMPGIYKGSDISGQSTDDLSETRIYTAFIDQWTTRNEFALKASRKYGTSSMYLHGDDMDASDGVGLSAVCSSSSFVLMDYYLQQAGVVDNSFDTAKPSASGDSNSLPYAIIAGNPEGLLKIEFARRSVPSALWFSITGSNQSSEWTLVGDPLFPAVLVRNEEIAGKVVASAKKPSGLYNFNQSYSVIVVPSGLAGSWADGCVESFLLAPWAFDMFQGSGKPEGCLTYLDDFYSTFYRASYKDVVTDVNYTKKTRKAELDPEDDEAGGEDPGEQEPEGGDSSDEPSDEPGEDEPAPSSNDS